MKLYLKICLFLSLATFPTIGLYSFYFFSPRNINHIFEFKDSVLKKYANTPKIIILGGSNASHGYDSETIEKELGTKTINMGISAAYGLEFYLQWIMPYLIPNDRLILSLEYELLHSKEGVYGRNDYIWLAYSYPDFYQSVTSSKERLMHFASYSSKYLVNVLDYYKPSRKTMSPNEVGKYISSTWTSNGDRIIQSRTGFKNYDVHLFIPDTNFKKAFKPFIARCKENKIEVFLNFPPLRRLNAIQRVSSKEMVEFFNREFPEIIILNKPEDGFFEDDEIYDSPYHIINSAKKTYTSKLCSNITSSYKRRLPSE